MTYFSSSAEEEGVRNARRAENSALIGGGHIAGGPVGRTADGAAARIGHDHETRQILIFSPEAIAQPGAQAGLADHDVSRVHLQAAGGVRRGIGIHGADHAQIVGKLGGVCVEHVQRRSMWRVAGSRDEINAALDYPFPLIMSLSFLPNSNSSLAWLADRTAGLHRAIDLQNRL